MELRFNKLIDWPSLSWVSSIPLTENLMTVYHGPMVETAADWFAEAVWAGDFESGNFDQTDLVFGTGARVRGEKIVFVASGTSTDRLWHCQRKGSLFVSNSLPALLAVAEIDLINEHHYFRDIRTICNGLSNYKRTIPVSDGDLNIHYFHNLIFQRGQLIEQEKPDTTPHFSCYKDYWTFLKDTSEQLSKNFNHVNRRNTIKPLASVSSGYDSCASAVVGKNAGCTHAVTITQSSSFWRGSDSGKEVAEYLGLIPMIYNIRASHYPNEAAVWAVSGRASVLNWTQFDFPKPLCAFFTGCRGDTVWDLSTKEVKNPFRVPSVSDMGIAEWRLSAGVFHVVVPFWGLRRVNELRAISHSAEMKPWSVGGSYDRPIARRIVETSGVPRNSFGVLKKNTSSEEYFTWPYSTDAKQSFRKFLHSCHTYVPPNWLVLILRKIVQLDRLIFLNVTAPLRLPDIGLRIRLRLRASWLLFHWGNNILKKTYRKGLASITSNGPTQNGKSINGGDK